MPSRTSVFLNVADVDRSLKFYRALGFKVASSTRHEGKVAYADLERDGAELGLGSIASNDDPEYRAWVGTPLGAGVVVYFTVPRGVDDLLEKARRAGAVVEMEPRDRPYGRVATVNDPDGYVLTFHQEPAKRRAPARKAKGKAKAAAPAKAAKKAARKAPKKAKGARGAR